MEDHKRLLPIWLPSFHARRNRLVPDTSSGRVSVVEALQLLIGDPGLPLFLPSQGRSAYSSLASHAVLY